MEIYRNMVTALIGPSGCGKSTFIRCLNRMNDSSPARASRGEILYHGEDLYGPASIRRGPPLDRDGVPEAEPVPEVDLRQRRLGAARARHEEGPRRARRAGADAAPRSGTRSRTASSGARSRSPAASSSACASPARSRSSRTCSCSTSRPPRSTRSRRGDRGSDARAQERLHDRDRDPQHAAGCPRRRQDRVLQPRVHEDGTRNGILVETTRRRRSSPAGDSRTEGYVTGRFG